jgi:hypothetical protein
MLQTVHRVEVGDHAPPLRPSRTSLVGPVVAVTVRQVHLGPLLTRSEEPIAGQGTARDVLLDGVDPHSMVKMDLVRRHPPVVFVHDGGSSCRYVTGLVRRRDEAGTDFTTLSPDVVWTVEARVATSRFMAPCLRVPRLPLRGSVRGGDQAGHHGQTDGKSLEKHGSKVPGSEA